MPPLRRQSRAPWRAALLAGAAALLAGIVGIADCAAEQPPTTAQAPDAVRDPFAARQIPQEFRDDVDRVVAGNTAFGLDLYAVRRRQSAGNLFLSPYSISTALAMTWAGARNRTEAEMAAVLRFPVAQDALHPAFAALQQSLVTGSGLGAYRLHIANRLWGDEGQEWLDEFLRITRESYDAPFGELDFVHQPEESRQTINAWAAEQTAGEISELIPQGVIGPYTALVLTDAIYFKGTWQRQFDPATTADAPFHPEPGRTVMVPTMMQDGELGYAELDGLRVLELPYAGRDLGMFVFLPEQVDGLTDLEARLDPAALASWMDAAKTVDVQVLLPRFELRSTLADLAPVLEGMGMPSAFGGAADFSGMTGDHSLFISDVIHEACVKVDEEGTEATAATGVAVALESMAPGRVFVADHPFLFLIRDNVTESLLFLGRVVDPSAH